MVSVKWSRLGFASAYIADDGKENKLRDGQESDDMRVAVEA